MPLKVPPPPTLPVQFQQLNRWLIELQSILNNQGTISQSSVDGLPALATEVATLTTEVTALTAEVATLTAEVGTLTADVATLTADVATNTANIATLTARNQVRNGAGVPGAGLGNNGDLYINNAGGVGTYLYGKIGGAWVAFA